MKTIDEFKAIPEIKEMIIQYKAWYCDKGNWWICKESEAIENYLDGAWFIFNEDYNK